MVSEAGSTFAQQAEDEIAATELKRDLRRLEIAPPTASDVLAHPGGPLQRGDRDGMGASSTCTIRGCVELAGHSLVGSEGRGREVPRSPVR